MEKKIKVIKIITILTCIILFMCTLILSFQFVKIANLREKSKDLENRKTEIISQINEYDATNKFYNNRTEYLENYAREVLGWDLNNDTWYTTSKN